MQTVLEFITQVNEQYGLQLSLRDIILTVLSPVFIVFFILEYFYFKRLGLHEKVIDFKESIVNFGLGATYQLAEGLASFIFLAALLIWVEQFQWQQIPANTISSIFILFVLQEFFYYWYHRSSHRISWFWCAHVVHHSSRRMNLSTAMRQSILYPFSGNFLFFIPLVLIGFSAQAVFACYAFNLAYQFFIHTQAVTKLHPLIEYIFNTPSHHRVHHGRNEKYIDKNYGGVLIIFDRIFGTFVEEDAAEPVEFGIVKQFDSLNLAAINLHEWKDMFRHAFQSGSIKEGLKHLIKPPEWRDRE